MLDFLATSLVFSVSLIALYLLVITLQRRHLPTARPLIGLSLFLVLTCTIQYCRLAGAPQFIFQAMFPFVFIASTCCLPLWAWFLIEFKQQQRVSLVRWQSFVLVIEPVIIGIAFFVLIVPNIWQPDFVFLGHNQVLKEIGFVSFRRIHIAYSTLLFIALFVSSLRIVYQKNKSNPFELVLFSACIFLPIVLFNLYVFGVIKIMLGAPALVFLLFWGVRQTRLLDTLPMAFDQIVNQVNAGVVVVNERKQIIFTNQYAKRLLFGDTAEAPTGIHPVSLPNILNNAFDYTGEHQQTSDIELAVQSANPYDNNENIISLAAQYSPLISKTSFNRARTIGSVIFLSDISERKAFEQERIDYTHKLEKAHQYRSDFFAGISHEFRTSLTLSLGPLNDLIEGNHGQLTNTVNRQLTVVEMNNHRLLSLVNQLLDLAELESNEYSIQPHVLKLNEYLVNITSGFEAQLSKHDIRLSIRCADDIEIYFDAHALDKIIYNLLSNAIKSLEHQGSIEIAGHQLSDGSLTLSVQDNGCGIPPALHSEIFNRYFYHRHSDHNNVPKGADQSRGIGLALVAQLTKLHNGNIKLESAEGEGSKFILTFSNQAEKIATAKLTEEYTDELDQTPTEETSNNLLDTHHLQTNIHSPINSISPIVGIDALAHQSQDSSSRLVLLVEDNAQMRAYIRFHLGSQYRLVEAEDGQEGLEIAMQMMPDIIITDIMMPNMDGYQLCYAIKQDDRVCHIPLIMLSARTANEDKLEGLRTGADEYLNKPFQPEELRLRIDNLLTTQSNLRKLLNKQLYSTEFETVESSNKNFNFMSKVMKYIVDHLADSSVRIEDMAKHVHLGERTFHRKIKAVFGESPQVILLTRRLKHARTLLQDSDLSISEISQASGFESPSYFSRKFRSHFKQTPSEFRNHMG